MRGVPAATHKRSAACPADADGAGPAGLLLRQVDGDLLIAPFRKRPAGPSPAETALVETVAQRLARDLPAGCFWIDPRDGRASPASIAVPQLQRRLLDDAWFRLSQPLR